jgi:hypothetical protein
MGKRELLLVVGFIVFGALVYQLTAPPAQAGEQSFSVSRLVESVRRHVRGNRATTELTTHVTYPLAPGTDELRVALTHGGAQSVTIAGEDRADIEAELRVWSNGYDDAEAQELAKATTLKPVEGAGSLSIDLLYPGPGQQRANLTLKVPSRLRVQIVEYGGRLAIAGTADVELLKTRGQAEVKEISGRVSGTHRGGDLNISDVGSLKLTTRGTDVRLVKIHGDATIQTQGGELRGSEIAGPLDVDANATDITFEQLEKAKGPIRVTAVAGSITMRGVASDVRIDSRNAEVEVVMDKAAPLAIYNEGNDPITVTPPSTGYELDLLATTGGRIRLPDGVLEVKSDHSEERAAGAVHGGGPTITLRANRGDIVVRTPDAPKHEGSGAQR